MISIAAIMIFKKNETIPSLEVGQLTPSPLSHYAIHVRYILYTQSEILQSDYKNDAVGNMIGMATLMVLWSYGLMVLWSYGLMVLYPRRNNSITRGYTKIFGASLWRTRLKSQKTALLLNLKGKLTDFGTVRSNMYTCETYRERRIHLTILGCEVWIWRSPLINFTNQADLDDFK